MYTHTFVDIRMSESCNKNKTQRNVRYKNVVSYYNHNWSTSHSINNNLKDLFHFEAKLKINEAMFL